MEKKIKAFSFFLLATAFTLFLSSATSQIVKTSLRITVRNDLGNLVEGAEVQLFKTFEDYEKNTNPATPVQYTDAKGNVHFKELEPIEYYLSVVKDDASNDGGGIQTGKLDAKKQNRVTTIIQ